MAVYLKLIGMKTATNMSPVLKFYEALSAQFICSVRRTKVIDDESDYFASDSKWLSKKERKVLKEKEDKLQQLKHGSRRDKKVTLDFAGRKVIEEKPTEEINGEWPFARQRYVQMARFAAVQTNTPYFY